MEILDSIGGGHLDDNEMSGGKVQIYPNPRNESVMRVLVGNTANISLRSRVSSFNAFKRVYISQTGTEKISDKTMTNLVSEMIGYDLPTMPEKDLVELITALMRESAENQKMILVRSFKIYQPLSMSIRSVFMLYKDHLEELLLKFDSELARVTNKSPQIPELMPGWREINKKYSIGSSSKILLFMFPPGSPRDLPHLSDQYKNTTKWHPEIKRMNMESDDKKLNTLIDKFRKSVTKFLYLGFCPKRPIYRLNKLMEFPTDDLLNCLQYMGSSVDRHIARYEALQKSILAIKLPKKIIEHKFSEATTTTSDAIGMLGHWLDFCKKNIQWVTENEKYYVAVADKFISLAELLKKFVYHH